MRKTNKNLTKQILTLMLAFVMVFTGMGIGSWGVDEAWADNTGWDGTIVSKPAQSEDGTYQIGTAAELAWFAALVNGTLTDGTAQNLAANAVLTADIDLNNKNWMPIGNDEKDATTKVRNDYAGTFDGKGYSVSNLKISGEARYVGLFGYASEGFIKNLHITNANIEGSSNCGILLGYNSKSRVLNCSVTKSTLDVEKNSGFICGGGDSSGSSSLENCFAKDNILKTDYVTPDSKYNKPVSGNIGGLVGNSGKLVIENCYVSNNTITHTPSGSEKSWGIISGTNRATIKNCYYEKAADDTNAYDCILGEEKDAAWFKSDEAVSTLGSEYTEDTTNANDGYPTLKVAVDVDTAALQAAISEAENKDAAKYYTSDDRWNGFAKSKNSFWADMQAALTAAKKIYDNKTANQEQIDAATAELQTAIKNLIPISQINPTALYEAVNTEWVWDVNREDNVVYDAEKIIGGQKAPISSENCTNITWTPYEEAKAAADKHLQELFLDGKPTDKNVNDEDGNAQKEADALAAAADPQQLVNQELYDSYYEQYMNRREEAGSLLKQYDPENLTESDYDTDSWKTYKKAYEALQTTYQHKNLGGTRKDYEVYKMFFVGVDIESQAKLYQTDALISAYNLLKSTADVTVSLTYVNNLTAAYPQLSGGTDAYQKQDIKLTGETNVYGALQAENIEYATTTSAKPTAGQGGKIELPIRYGKTMPSTALVTPYLSVFVNGEFRGIYAGAEKTKAVNLKKGDEVTVARVLAPQELSEASSGLTSTQWSWAGASRFEYEDSLAMIALTPEKTTVKVGDKLNISTSVTDAYGKNFGETQSAKGLTLFVSEPSETESITAPSKNTAETTDANGKTGYTFTKSGWYTIALYDLQEDSYTLFDVYQNYTMGTYHSLVAGDIALVYVEAVDDETALIEKYRKENLAKAKTLFDSYTEYDFADGYYQNTWEAAYKTLKSNQEDAKSFDALMTQFDADYANLQKLAKENAADYAGITETIKEKLQFIPEDLTTLDEAYAEAILEIQQTYGSLNAADEKRDAYQKRFFTPKELERLDAIAKLDVKTFKELRTITVNVKDFRNLPLAVDIGQSGGASVYGWPQLTWSMTPNLDGSVQEPVWTVLEYHDTFAAKAGDHAYVRAYLATDDEKYWMVWSVDGENWNLSEPQTLKSYHGEWISGYFLADYQIPKDIDTDTITIAVKMISKAKYEELVDPAETHEQLRAAKTAAQESLKAAYEGYKNSKLESVYLSGYNSIEKAQTMADVAKARKDAMAALAAAAASSGSSGGEPGTKPTYPSGKTVGKVKVIVENTKYPGGAFTGQLIDGWYDLGENDNMMTCVLKALYDKGYGWNGTKDFDKENPLDNYTITYLGYIEKDGKTLGEFDGSNGSGWMGTLNDWFVNESFAAFSVKDGRLENGDTIHVMFTLSYGEDIGGTWGNGNTKLDKLTVTGGTLSPSFSGDNTEYTLVINEDKDGKANVTVKPEAVNKNYQARIFLNSYNKDSARYKMTETISVKSGDILYVGVGEKGWPTMNASSVGTKYTIRVVSGSDSTAVAKMLKALKDITYANYKAEKGNVEAARAAYNALTDKSGITAEDLKKLTDAEAQIKFYSEIDDVKAKFAALKATSSESAARNAYNAYKKLSAEQQEYITIEDSNIYNELAKKYNLSSVAGSAEMPESEVETTGTTGSAVTTSPTTVKMSGTTATVTVRADNQKEILKQAKEKKSAQVVLAIANSDAKGAEKLELNLEKSFLESLLKDTNAKLVVKTPLGQKTYEREELQKLVNEATGTTVKAEINKDNVDTKVEEPTEDNAAKIEKAKSIVKDMKLVARSSKTAKKNIKAVLKSDAKVKASIKELKDLGFTVKYRFYRSTKKAASYKSTVTKKAASYTNTSGKKGTKYFYKVQVRVYDENGKLVAKTALKQCKYASRTWTK